MIIWVKNKCSIYYPHSSAPQGAFLFIITSP
jgi:hypothetical protein